MSEVLTELIAANCKNAKDLAQTEKATDFRDKTFNRDCFYT